DVYKRQPIMYPAELVKSWIGTWSVADFWKMLLYKLYLLNPLTMLSEAYRKTLLPLTGLRLRGTAVEVMPLDYWMLTASAVICLLVALGGYAFFNSRKWVFAERV
ncbi:MAG: hypothetical protein N3B12_08585, partial [Armatimonadetes bacterium]|nr:hypothetical protein [Armatimonadota bacterium]